MKEEKRKGRRAYLDSFRRNGKGEYEYTGKMYTFRGSSPDTAEEELGRAVRKLWVLWLVSAAALAAAGCIRAPGMDNCFYVLLPYVAGIAGELRVFLAVYRLASGGASLKEYEYEGSIKVLPGRAAVLAVCSGACGVCEIVFVCLNGLEGLAAGFGGFLALCAVEAATAAALYRKAAALKRGYFGTSQTG